MIVADASSSDPHPQNANAVRTNRTFDAIDDKERRSRSRRIKSICTSSPKGTYFSDFVFGDALSSPCDDFECHEKALAHVKSMALLSCKKNIQAVRTCHTEIGSELSITALAVVDPVIKR